MSMNWVSIDHFILKFILQLLCTQFEIHMPIFILS